MASSSTSSTEILKEADTALKLKNLQRAEALYKQVLESTVGEFSTLYVVVGSDF